MNEEAKAEANWPEPLRAFKSSDYKKGMPQQDCALVFLSSIEFP